MSYSVYSPPLSKTNKMLLIVMGVGFLLQTLFEVSGSGFYTGLLSLRGGEFFGGHLYQLLTYPLVSSGLFPLIFDGLCLWFIGSELEFSLGTPKYRILALSSILSGGVFYLLCQGGLSLFGKELASFAPMIGISGLCYALLFAFAAAFPERQMSFFMLFPMKAKVFCLLLGGIELYLALFSPYRGSSWGHLGAILGGLIVLRLTSPKRAPAIFDWKGYFKEATKGTSKKKGNLTLVKPENLGDDPSKADKKNPKYWQ